LDIIFPVDVLVRTVSSKAYILQSVDGLSKVSQTYISILADLHC